MRPAQSCGMVSPDRLPATEWPTSAGPSTLAKPGSTGALPTVAVDAAHRHVLGQDLVEQRRLCGGPSTQPHVASVNGALTFFGRRQRRAEIGQRRVDLLLLHGLPRPAFGRPEPVVVERMRLARSAGTCLRRAPAPRPDRPGSCPPPCRRSFTGVGMVSGVSVPTQVLMPRRRAKREHVAEERRPCGRTGRCTARATSCSTGCVSRM